MPDLPNIRPATAARVLAEAMPYLREYHGKVLVVRFGGRAMADASLMSAFARDVALLRLSGMKPVVVHGGGWRIDEQMRKMGLEPRRVGGFRVTDAETLNVVEMALDELNQELTGLINRHGGRAIGINGQDGRFIRARRMAGPDGADLGFVGEPASVDVELVDLLLSREFVPVVMPIGVGEDGTAYHINSDLLASRLARELGAEKLVLMTNVAGIAGADGRTVWILRAREAQAMLREGRVEPAMARRVEAALAAVREGVRSVHIIDGGVPDALLLEVLTADGAGTAIRSDATPDFLEDSRAYLLATGQS
ncbi:MAG: acetylglutamate kinase [Betaproteobacteria bacterium]|nr:acetylglutamate kinase [Betaproteobacteria bacterium]MDH5285052.1 acetylglutamate kinase [Betaproteobacteria bacterium]